MASLSRVYIPPSGRMMVFIDGENTVLRYQALRTKGFEPRGDVVHEPDIYVWKKEAISHAGHEIIRATLYTSLVGDNDRMDEVASQIKKCDFNTYSYSYKPNNLTPCIFKKNRKEDKAKGVDIKMTIDILHHLYNDNFDAAYLITGDGDYAPVIDEVIRNGKNVFLAAFSDGLNSRLPFLADKFFDLDQIFFTPS